MPFEKALSTGIYTGGDLTFSLNTFWASDIILTIDSPN